MLQETIKELNTQRTLNELTRENSQDTLGLLKTFNG